MSRGLVHVRVSKELLPVGVAYVRGVVSFHDAEVERDPEGIPSRAERRHLGESWPRLLVNLVAHDNGKAWRLVQEFSRYCAIRTVQLVRSCVKGAQVLVVFDGVGLLRGEASWVIESQASVVGVLHGRRVVNTIMLSKSETLDLHLQRFAWLLVDVSARPIRLGHRPFR